LQQLQRERLIAEGVDVHNGFVDMERFQV